MCVYIYIINIDIVVNDHVLGINRINQHLSSWHGMAARCWTQIEGGLPCLDAIKLGQAAPRGRSISWGMLMDGCPNWSQTWKTASCSARFWRWHGWQDCHCKCASEYVRMGSIRGRVSCLNWAIWPFQPRFSIEGVALTCSRWMIIRSRCIINDTRHMLVQFTSRLDLDLQNSSRMSPWAYGQSRPPVFQSNSSSRNCNKHVVNPTHPNEIGHLQNHNFRMGPINHP